MKTETAELMAYITIAILMGVFLILCSLVVYDLVTGASCHKKYTNTEYSFFGGCKVELNGEYIPEEIYKIQYERNLRINK